MIVVIYDYETNQLVAEGFSAQIAFLHCAALLASSDRRCDDFLHSVDLSYLIPELLVWARLTGRGP
jgi:hypothetical protein